MQKRVALLISLIVVLGLAVGCSSRPSEKDQEIQKDIQTKVAAEPETTDSQVAVAAKEGKVTLTGKVKTPAAQKKVEQIAKEEPGAVAVDDQTTVDPEAMAQPLWTGHRANDTGTQHRRLHHAPGGDAMHRPKPAAAVT